jgi:hypothetical protein
MTENRANVNDGVIWWHRGYYSYLPTIGGGAAPHALIASIYPIGVQANTSSKHWDARVAFIDRAPAHFVLTASLVAASRRVRVCGLVPRRPGDDQATRT